MVGEPPLHSACLAPQVQLDLRPNGDVRVCCRNETPLGNLAVDRLGDLWAGHARQRVVASLARHDYGAGCGHCGAEVAAEGRGGSYPEQFDQHAATVADGSAWPSHIEFTLSINCNLQCAQCNGEASSAIRAHREGRPPLPKVYDDRFFEDLRTFIPHLRSASFSGGEPFLAEENFRVWDLIAELNPDLEVTIITNATQWTPRVESVLERLRCSFRLSIDGFTPRTYESIRVGADHQRVMANVERFVASAADRGTEVAINHCLVRQNVHEFGDLLRWADDLDVTVHVSVVRDDPRVGSGGELFSIVRCPPEEIAVIHRSLQAQDPVVRPALGRNRRVWVEELDRLGSWAAATPDELRGLWGVSGATVLMFTRAGSGPNSDVAARAELARFDERGVAHGVVWGPDETVVSVDGSLAGVLGEEAVALMASGSPRDMVGALESALGPMEEYRVVREEPDRVDAEAGFERCDVRVTMMPLRDANGWAERGVQLMAFRHRGGGSGQVP
ncbi:MAG: radical SAM protein [Microthrixaceae bacterium]